MVTKASEPKRAIDSKVKCRECGTREHILVAHIREAHDLTPLAYLEKHGGIDSAPLWSAYGAEVLRRTTGATATAVAQVPRPRRLRSVAKLFPDFGKHTNTKPRGKVQVFDTISTRTPRLDLNYVFPEEQTLDLITILEKPHRNRPFIKGWSGTGKTQLVVNLAAKVGAPLRIWNADSQQQRPDIIGHWTVKDGETIFEYGILPLAMMHGEWLLVNEIDTLDPHILNILKPMLEDPSTLTILEKGDEFIEAHPDFRIIATANTWARGDETGLFVNTLTQSDADARRWSARLLLDYMPEVVECEMLVRYFGDQLDADEPKKFVTVANKTREAFKLGKIDKTFSPAELINWVENFLTFAKTVHHAARLSFLNACAPDVQTAIGEMITAVFGVESVSAAEPEVAGEDEKEE